MPARVTVAVGPDARGVLASPTPAGGRVLAWPPENPVVIAAVDCSARPPVGVATQADGSFAVLDGELFADDARMDSGSPEEQAATLLDIWRRGGVEAVSRTRLAGALVVWHAPTAQLQVIRDLSGATGVFHAAVGRSTVVSTELTGLLAAGVPPEPDRVTLDAFLAVGGTWDPMSFLAGTAVLPSGWALTAHPERAATTHRFAAPQSHPPLDLDPDGSSAMFGGLLTDAVTRRIRTDGALGMHLSAGIDSALLGALARAAGADPVAFTFDYAAHDGRFSEGQRAARVAEVLGLEHHVVTVTPGELAARFTEVVASFEHPFTYGVHSFAQDALVQRGIGAVLNGAGPDNGYEYGRASVAAGWFRALPVQAQLLALDERISARLPGKVPGVQAYASLGIFSERTSFGLRQALHGPVAVTGRRALLELLQRHTASFDGPRAARPSLADTQYLEPNNTGQWNRRYSVTFGFPIRQPYWDPAVMSFIQRTDRDLQGKPYLRRYAATVLPPDIVSSPKLGQELPLTQWLRGALLAFTRDALSRPRVEASGLFDADTVTRIVEEHARHDHDHTWTIWMLMTIVEWHLQMRARTWDTERAVA